jgi:hypothetical protein
MAIIYIHEFATAFKSRIHAIKTFQPAAAPSIMGGANG